MSDVSKPTDEQLAGMSREELVELGGRLDGVETVFKEDRWPVEGTAPRSAPSAALRCGCWSAG